MKPVRKLGLGQAETVTDRRDIAADCSHRLSIATRDIFANPSVCYHF